MRYYTPFCILHTALMRMPPDSLVRCDGARSIPATPLVRGDPCHDLLAASTDRHIMSPPASSTVLPVSSIESVPNAILVACRWLLVTPSSYHIHCLPRKIWFVLVLPCRRHAL